MNKPLVRLLLSPADLLLSYQPTYALSWHGHALAQRFKRGFRALQMSLGPVSSLSGISIQDEGQRFAVLASPVVKTALVVHHLSWKYHHKQDTYNKKSSCGDGGCIPQPGYIRSWLKMALSQCPCEMMQAKSATVGPEFLEPCYQVRAVNMHHRSAWHFSFIRDVDLFASIQKPEQQHSCSALPYQLPAALL